LGRDHTQEGKEPPRDREYSGDDGKKYQKRRVHPLPDVTPETEITSNDWLSHNSGAILPVKQLLPTDTVLSAGKLFDRKLCRGPVKPLKEKSAVVKLIDPFVNTAAGEPVN
jgi:hypothetical protein